MRARIKICFFYICLPLTHFEGLVLLFQGPKSRVRKTRFQFFLISLLSQHPSAEARKLRVSEASGIQASKSRRSTADFPDEISDAENVHMNPSVAATRTQRKVKHRTQPSDEDEPEDSSGIRPEAIWAALEEVDYPDFSVISDT